MSTGRLPRAFWHVFGASTISTLGDGFLLVGLPLLAEASTTSALAVSGVLVAQRIPWIIGVVFGGIADRREPRATMVLMDLLRAILLLVLGAAVLLTDLPVALIYVAAFAHATADVVFLASAQAIIPSLVSAEQRGRANGYLDASSSNGEQLVGPPLGGLLFSVSRALPIVADAATFLVSALLLRGVASIEREAASTFGRRSSLRSDLRDALRVFQSLPRLYWNVVITIPPAFAQAMTLGVLVVLSRRTLELSSFFTGIFLAGIAAGNVVGGLIAPWFMTRMRHGQLLVMSFAVVAASYFAVYGQRNAVVVSLTLFFEGVAVVVAAVSSITLRQSLMPDDMRGKLSALSRGLVYTAISIGALVGGLVTDAYGTDTTFLAAGIIVFVWLIVSARVYQQVQAARPVA